MGMPATKAPPGSRLRQGGCLLPFVPTATDSVSVGGRDHDSDDDDDDKNNSYFFIVRVILAIITIVIVVFSDEG